MLPITNNEYFLHILETYASTRIGIAIIGILFPLILFFGGNITGLENSKGSIFGLGILPSLSAYYHSPMRNWFVGILFAVGVSLWLYKGYSTFEDFTLDAAGIFAIGVAIFPTSCSGTSYCDTFTKPGLHNVSAFAFFGCIAIISIAEAFGFLHRKEILKKDKFIAKTKNTTTLYKMFTVTYIVLAIAMVVLPLLAWLLYRETSIATFKIELAGVWVFSTYWIVKTIEIYHYSLETSDTVLNK